MIRVSQRGKVILEQVLVSEKKKEIQKNRPLRVTARDPSGKVNHLSKVMGDRKDITKFTRCIRSTRIG